MRISVKTSPPARRRARDYAMAVGAVAATSAAMRLACELGPGAAGLLAAYAPLWLGLAVVLAGLVAGRGPAVAAALVAAVLGWYLFLPPAYSFGLDGWGAAALGLFTVCSLAVALALSRPGRHAGELR